MAPSRRYDVRRRHRPRWRGTPHGRLRRGPRIPVARQGVGLRRGRRDLPCIRAARARRNLGPRPYPLLRMPQPPRRTERRRERATPRGTCPRGGRGVNTEHPVTFPDGVMVTAFVSLLELCNLRISVLVSGGTLTFTVRPQFGCGMAGSFLRREAPRHYVSLKPQLPLCRTQAVDGEERGFGGWLTRSLGPGSKGNRVPRGGP